MDGIISDCNSTQNFYEDIKNILVEARKSAYRAVNFTMVLAYWEIGKRIYERIGKDGREEYGKELLKDLSQRLTYDFGKGFTVSNLKYMRQFYMCFPIRHALRGELSWTHYRLLSQVSNEKARLFYLEECIKANWSTRQLERQIHSYYYERLLSSRDKESVS